MASGNNRRIRKVLCRGRELVLTEPKGRVSLAYRELTEVSREVFLRPKSVIILDLSYNSIKYPCNHAHFIFDPKTDIGRLWCAVSVKIKYCNNGNM